MSCTEHGQKGNARGYGMAWLGGRIAGAHRVAYCKAHALALAEIEGQIVRHKCDNPRCVNPDHLELGTQAENLQDMVDRGRSPHFKLTDEQVAEIRRRYTGKRGECPALAREFGVDRTYIWALVKKGKRT